MRSLRTPFLLLTLTLAGCAGGRELNTLGTPVPADPAGSGNPCAVVSPRGVPPEVHRDSLDVPPEIVGGLEGLVARVRYPEVAQRTGIEGAVCVQFVVDEQGEVRDVEVIRSAHPLLDAEAVRAVRASEFRPGSRNGEPVSVLFTLPVQYRLRGGPDLVGTLLGTAALLGVIVLLAVLQGPPE